MITFLLIVLILSVWSIGNTLSRIESNTDSCRKEIQWFRDTFKNLFTEHLDFIEKELIKMRELKKENK